MIKRFKDYPNLIVLSQRDKNEIVDVMAVFHEKGLERH